MFERKTPTEEQIARRAHEIYVQRGGEHGRDVEDWVRAENELNEVPVSGPAKTKLAKAGGNMSN